MAALTAKTCVNATLERRHPPAGGRDSRRQDAAQMSSVRKSLSLGFAQTYSAMIFQFVASMLIARLLVPHDLGIFSVAAVLVGLAQTVRAFGVPTYIVQEKELTEERIRSAMGVAILVGWVLAGVVALVSVPAALFYREPGVRDVMLVLALNFLLMPFGSVTM